MARNKLKNGNSVSRQKSPAKLETKSNINGNNDPHDNNIKGATIDNSNKQPSSFPFMIGCLLVAAMSCCMGVLTSVIQSSRINHPKHTPQQLLQGLWKSRTRMNFIPISTDHSPLALCTDEELANFLHEEPVQGMHVVCLQNNTGSSSEKSIPSLQLRLFKGASFHYEEQVNLSSTEQTDWNTMRGILQDKLALSKMDDLHQPWGIFNALGQRLLSENTLDENNGVALDRLVHSGIFLLFQGGQWLWPGVRVGFRRTIDLYSIMPNPLPPALTAIPKRTTILETLSLKPLILSVEDFLSEEECDYIQQMAAPRMQYSGVKLIDSDKGKEASEFRTSQSTFLVSKGDVHLTELDHRTASLVRIPTSHQEDVQVLRYGKDQHYVAHHDFFNPDFYQTDASMLNMIQHGRRNRFATVFCYFSTVDRGGETVFPRWGGKPQPSDFADCTKGLKVKPERGKVIIFYSLTPDGKMDEFSLHGACPVDEGIKWAGNKWVWNAPIEIGPN